MPFLGKEPAFDLANTSDLGDNIVTEAKLKDALVGEFTEVTITAADSILLGDATDSGNTKRDTVQGILDLAGGGGTAVLARATFSGASAVAITAFDSSNYDAYKIYWQATIASGDADILYRTSTDGGSSYDSSSGNYAWRHIINDGGSPPVDYNLTSTTEGRTTRRASAGGALMHDGTGENAVGEVTIIAPDASGSKTLFMANHLGFNGNSVLQYSQLYFARLSAADVDAIQISPDTSTITGRYVLLGIKNST